MSEMDETTAVSEIPRVDLHRLLSDFVLQYEGMKQRDQHWYSVMGVTVGGSELAAIMGLNPYSKFLDVVKSKLLTLAGGHSWTGGGEACWWGTLFEDVIGAYVEADLGGKILGDDICVQVYEGHRNSPDGYIVAKFYHKDDGGLHLWTTDIDPGIKTIERILLLEFKCPMSRKPQGKVPRQYVPQVWSGLAVSPVAHFGTYVDAVFRKCSIFDLEDTPIYDTKYHHSDRGMWGLPHAWGVIGVYAPRINAPRHLRLGWRGVEWAAGDPDPDAPDADAAYAAWQIHTTYFGITGGDTESSGVADLGDMDPQQFGRTLSLINRGRFPVTRVAACFADGRGYDLHTGHKVGATIESLRTSAPEHHWLMGVLPWKLLDVSYIFVDRRPGFMAEVAPLIADVHRTVREAREAPSSAVYLAEKARAAYLQPSESISEAEIQVLFDSIP